jgi:peptidoglycan/LPS O-acetylase OafA/YrhL
MSFSKFAASRVILLYPLIFVGLLLGLIVFILRAGLSHQSPVTPNVLIAVILEACFIPFPPILGQTWPVPSDLSAPFDPPAWSLCFEFIANFVYAAFVTRLTKPMMTFLLGVGASLVFAQIYLSQCYNGREPG